MSNIDSCNSVALVVMARRARELNTNRQGDVGWLEGNLDPEGVHLAEISFPHMVKDENRLDMRCKWLCKVKDTIKPHVVWLDVPINEYEKLIDKKEEA